MQQENCDSRPLIAHVVYRFDTGGLENGIVNLINNMPPHLFRHVVIALTEVTEFRTRIKRDDVQFISLHKPPGQGFWQFPKLFRLFRKLKPSVVHSRNLAALEVQLPAWFAGVPVRIHGEHGRDIGDLDGSNRKLQWVRRFYRPFVSYYLALSRDLADDLVSKIHIPQQKVLQVYNGVDTARFHPASPKHPIPGCPFSGDSLWLIGTVGRMQPVKDQTNLVRAFILAVQSAPQLRDTLRLIIVGDGPLRSECKDLLAAAGMSDLAWLPGERADIPEIMRGLDCFVLPSLAEGISNTILEAMASGLPVLATEVGGNADLVSRGITGNLVPASNHEALASAMVQMASEAQETSRMGAAGRHIAETRFSMGAMVNTYVQTYDALLQGVGQSTKH